ncbi:hypothetical protein HAX54_010263 [Datura stramonium]|uniref:Uncharacterized protein n=1 Tax=Datura stramonium TaxID=4076 RepID=A0ABS8X0I2_DATST|nr:hypothetical protein [Datura stramonium]
MATTSMGQPPPKDGSANTSQLNFAATLRPAAINYKPLPLKPVIYLHRESRVESVQGEARHTKDLTL